MFREFTVAGEVGAWFPSPCGVWVVSLLRRPLLFRNGFPFPCGVWVVSVTDFELCVNWWFPSPCGVWVVSCAAYWCARCVQVSVPLRGVGCFSVYCSCCSCHICFRPLAGCGLFLDSLKIDIFPRGFPSPCGVWVVSANRLE